MPRPSKYSPELRERAVRMVFDHAHEYPSQWATMRSVADKLGCTTEALRRWVSKLSGRSFPCPVCGVLQDVREGHVTATKGGRVRHVPMTGRLTEALRQSRSLKSHRVVCDRKGTPLSQKEVQVLMRRVGRKANVKPGVHILRHTFCSHLAMRGAPAKAIQELAGHQDLATTQQYMHLSPAALDAAIRLLEMGTQTSSGKILEAAGTGSVTA